MTLRQVAYFPRPNLDDHASELEHLYATSPEHEEILDAGGIDAAGTFYIRKAYITATQDRIIRDLAIERITSRYLATLPRSEA